MVEQGLYYEHSGRVTYGGLVLMVLSGLLGGVLLGGVYGVCQIFLPIVNIAILVGMCFCVGGLTAFSLSCGKVRNRKVMYSWGFLLGCFCVYTSWVGWLFAVSDFSELILWPIYILLFIVGYTFEGAWQFQGSQYGWYISLPVILLEGVVIVLGGMWCSRDQLTSEPYCNYCNRCA